MVPMVEQKIIIIIIKKKTMRKDTFFKLGSVQRLGSEKWDFCGKRVGFLKSDKRFD